MKRKLDSEFGCQDAKILHAKVYE